VGATYGGKAIQQSEFNYTQLKETGISGDVVFDPTDGWCNYESSSVQCNKVANGSQISPVVEVITDLQGFSHGNTGWV
jgi:hypothetical protein